MKQYLNHKNLPWLTLIAGAIGLLLRVWLNNCINDRGFIIRGHISAILLYILTTAYVAGLIYATRPLVQASKYRFNFPASLPGAVGAAAAAVGFALTSISQLTHSADALTLLAGLLGLLSAASLVFVAYSRWKGLHPSAIFHAVICVYLMLRLICMYRQWSSDPQLLDYCFQLLAIVCLMLSAYHRASFDANSGRRHSYVFFNLAAVYFCCLSIAGPEHILFFLGSCLWQVTDLCDLTPMPREVWENAE